MKVMRRWCVWVLLVGSLVLALPGAAQSSWEVLVYNDYMAHFGVIIAVSGEGSRMIQLPDMPFPPSAGVETDPTSISTTDASLSPDGRWLAVVHAARDGSVARLLIADVLNGACCWFYQSLPVVYAIDLGDFDPTSTRLALSYVGEGADGEPFVGGMAIIPPQLLEDTAAQTVPMTLQTPLLPDLPAGVWARMGRWLDDGIRFSPNCYACDGGFMGEYSIWNPDTNIFIAHSGEFFTGFGERLDATGEMIVAGNDTNYVSGTEMGMFPPSNVIRYTPGGMIDGPDARVVFADPRLLDISEVHWVLDGQAVLIVSPEPYWVLLYRDGTVREIGGVLGHYFFAGTPDGWLTRSGDEEGNITLWHWTETGNIQVAIYGAGADTRLLRAALLGTRLPQPPPAFPVVLPPDPRQLLNLQPPPPAAVNPCSGAPPSRLMVGRQGRVTPGDPNRVRSEPGLTNTTVLGQIPGGGYFMVMDGPVCDASTGINWWLVSYGALTGWTAEGQGDAYFVEPAF